MQVHQRPIRSPIGRQAAKAAAEAARKPIERLVDPAGCGNGRQSSSGLDREGQMTSKCERRAVQGGKTGGRDPGGRAENYRTNVLNFAIGRRRRPEEKKGKWERGGGTFLLTVVRRANPDLVADPSEKEKDFFQSFPPISRKSRGQPTTANGSEWTFEPSVFELSFGSR